jgi:glycosyltransferase involved in cell wall biosynthesis
MKINNKDTKIKILIAYQYLSFKGGIEEVILNQSKYLKEEGYNVEILTSKFLPNEPLITKDGITIHRIQSFNFVYKFFGIPFALPFLDPFNLIRISKIIQKSDLINIHGHPYFSSFIYLILGKILQKPIVITQHNTSIKSNSTVINHVYTLFDKTIGKFNLNNADQIITVSDETKKYVEPLTRNKQKIETIYNGIDSNKFFPIRNKKQLRSKFGIPSNKFICLTIRRLTFKNGIETFLNVAKLSDQYNILFLLGGTGPDAQKIQNYIKTNSIHNVKLLGFIVDKDLSSYYALSDVFILPSIQGEGFPMVVLESFSSGLPVIATKSGGHIEIIKNGITGYLTDINNPIQISQKIEYLSGQSKEIQKMSNNCRSLIQRRFSWKVNIHQLISLYERMIS